MTAYELNKEFFEEYKSVDAFIRNVYRTDAGVSAYIGFMEETGFDEGRRYCVTWKDDFYKLKHMRWLRNKLAHDVGMDEPFCEVEDLQWLRLFHDRLKKWTDPLSAKQLSQGRRTQSVNVPQYVSGSSGQGGCLTVVMTMIAFGIAVIFILLSL